MSLRKTKEGKLASQGREWVSQNFSGRTMGGGLQFLKGRSYMTCRKVTATFKALLKHFNSHGSPQRILGTIVFLRIPRVVRR